MMYSSLTELVVIFGTAVDEGALLEGAWPYGSEGMLRGAPRWRGL